MLARARELGFRTFLGCMEETSVAIAASAAVASLADWVDLDGSLLLADDPFDGLELGAGPPLAADRRPGLGVRRAAWTRPSDRAVDKLVDEKVENPPSGERGPGRTIPALGRDPPGRGPPTPRTAQPRATVHLAVRPGQLRCAPAGRGGRD